MTFGEVLLDVLWYLLLPLQIALFVALSVVVWRENRQRRHPRDDARDAGDRREVDAYPKKTSASA